MCDFYDLTWLNKTLGSYLRVVLSELESAFEGSNHWSIPFGHWIVF